MARKKKTEKKQEVKQEQLKVNHSDKKGTIILVPYEELPGYILGGKYEYNGIPVRLVFIGEPSKLEVI